MAKSVVVYIFAVVVCVLLAPVLVTIVFDRFNEGHTVEEVQAGATHEIENVSRLASMLFEYYTYYERMALFDELEEYIVMVVAAEMPALFHMEALKAQAVAARTYAVHQLIESPGAPLSSLYQAYTTEEALLDLWGNRFDYFMARIRLSVESTRGEIMLYDGEPILAVFHAISAGQTELAENVWVKHRPYLVSVFSCNYEGVNGFIAETTITANNMAWLLGGNATDRLTIIQRSEADYVLHASFGDRVFTGREIRELLGLRSTNFDIVHNEAGDAIFTTRGHGHGVGMSQHGANNRALQGANYIQILTHYFYNISFGFLQ